MLAADISSKENFILFLESAVVVDHVLSIPASPILQTTYSAEQWDCYYAHPSRVILDALPLHVCNSMVQLDCVTRNAQYIDEPIEKRHWGEGASGVTF